MLFVPQHVLDAAIFRKKVKHQANHLNNLFCITFHVYSASNKSFESCSIMPMNLIPSQGLVLTHEIPIILSHRNQ